MDEPLTAIEAELKLLLEGRRGDWQPIVDKSGVSHSWLSKFVNGHIDNPGVDTLRKVRAAIATNDASKVGAK